MTLPTFTQLLLKAKKEKELSFEDLGKLIDRDEVWAVSYTHLTLPTILLV